MGWNWGERILGNFFPPGVVRLCLEFGCAGEHEGYHLREAAVVSRMVLGLRPALVMGESLGIRYRVLAFESLSSPFKVLHTIYFLLEIKRSPSYTYPVILINSSVIMDPFTIATTILGIIKLIDQANRLLDGLHSAPGEFARFLSQVKNLTSILSNIHTDLILDRDSIINRSKTLKEENRLDLDDLIKQCEKGIRRVQRLLNDYRGVTRSGFWNRDRLNWTKKGKQEVGESLADLQSLTGLVNLFITKEVAQGVGRLEHEMEELRRTDRRRERQRNRETRALFAHLGISMPHDPGRDVATLLATSVFASVFASRWVGRLRTRKAPLQSGRVSKPASKPGPGRENRPNAIPLPATRKDSLRSGDHQTRIVAPQPTTRTVSPPSIQLRGWRVASGSYVIGPKIHQRVQLKRTPSQLQDLANLAQTRHHKSLDRRHHAVKWLMGQLGSKWLFVGGRSEGGERFVIVVKRD